jgi:hypothetical protein
MITDSFDSRTLANMEVALERACSLLPAGADTHEFRRVVARRILQRARSGATTLGKLTEAGEAAANELCQSPIRQDAV